MAYVYIHVLLESGDKIWQLKVCIGLESVPEQLLPTVTDVVY